MKKDSKYTIWWSESYECYYITLDNLWLYLCVISLFEDLGYLINRLQREIECDTDWREFTPNRYPCPNHIVSVGSWDELINLKYTHPELFI